MGSFYFINTPMKTFTQFIKETNVTPETRNAINKFGSNKTFKKIGRGAGIGKQSLPGTRSRPTR